MKRLNKTKKFFLSLIILATCVLTFTYAKGKLSYTYKDKLADKRNKEVPVAKSSVLHTSELYPDCQTTPPDTAEPHLSGRTISNKDAVKLADSIIVGKIISLGEAEPDAPGQQYYGHVKVSAIRAIKGVTAKTFDISLTVQVFPAKSAEEKPKIDQEYIIFLKRPAPGVIKGIKLLVANSPNLADIANLANTK